MQEIVDIVAKLGETPLPTLLVVAGLFFLLLSVAGRVGAMIVVNPSKQAVAAIIGSVLLIAGIAMGTFLPDQPKQMEKAEGEKQESEHQVLTREFLTTTKWAFLHIEGDVISPNVRLDASGTIEGIDHPNEARWGLEEGMLVFYNTDGQPSTRFTDVTRDRGKIILSGRLLLTDEVVIHVLKEQ